MPLHTCVPKRPKNLIKKKSTFSKPNICYDQPNFQIADLQLAQEYSNNYLGYQMKLMRLTIKQINLGIGPHILARTKNYLDNLRIEAEK